jgi:hypothetical protein
VFIASMRAVCSASESATGNLFLATPFSPFDSYFGHYTNDYWGFEAWCP